MLGKLFHSGEWDEVLEKLKAQKFPTDEIGPAIVKLGKPYNEKRILRAKNVVAAYLKHPDNWVRHEAMWFLGSWGKLRQFQPALIDALQNDPDSDNRDYASLCLAHLLRGTGDLGAIKALKEVVLNEKEDKLVRLSSYGALLEIVDKRSGVDFQANDKDLSDIDWAWVRSLPISAERR